MTEIDLTIFLCRSSLNIVEGSPLITMANAKQPGFECDIVLALKSVLEDVLGFNNTVSGSNIHRGLPVAPIVSWCSMCSR
jgi:hypothetical protein